MDSDEMGRSSDDLEDPSVFWTILDIVNAIGRTLEIVDLAVRAGRFRLPGRRRSLWPLLAQASDAIYRVEAEYKIVRSMLAGDQSNVVDRRLDLEVGIVLRPEDRRRFRASAKRLLNQLKVLENSIDRLEGAVGASSEEAELEQVDSIAGEEEARRGIAVQIGEARNSLRNLLRAQDLLVRDALRNLERTLFQTRELIETTKQTLGAP